MKYYTKIKTTIGSIFLLSDGNSLLALNFTKDSEFESAILKKDLKIFIDTETQLNEYLEGNRKNFKLNLKPIGTDFQKTAWKTLQKIPFGKVLSYGEQAKLMNKPKAQRATGSANGKNPLPIIIPCHRIITSDRKLGGYSGDIKLKEKLLKLEGHLFKNDRLV